MNNKHVGPLFFSHTFPFLEEYLSIHIGRSSNTVESYRDTLTVFRRFVLEELDVSISKFLFSDCTRVCVQDFLAYLKGFGNSESTRNHRLAGLKTYLAYAAGVDVTLQSIWIGVSSIRPIRVPTLEKKILSESQMTLILKQAPNTFKGVRNRTMLLLLYETAERISELLALKLDNLHLEGDRPYIKVEGKGRKERCIAITKETAQHVMQYVGLCDKDSSDLLFPTKIHGVKGQMSARNVQDFLRTYANSARVVDPSIPLGAHPHMLRRSKSTTLYQSGMPLALVSSFLGHAQLETTRIYAKPSMEMLREALKAATPEQDKDVKPLWEGKEDLMAKKCGLR